MVSASSTSTFPEGHALLDVRQQSSALATDATRRAIVVKNFIILMLYANAFKYLVFLFMSMRVQLQCSFGQTETDQKIHIHGFS
mmetsp:Transcript_15934/g.25881  ORF Transcript_15934/g.25881 Transcript_15934/m.25881 type:complete len:84 (+) Transcript_15934:372-623(+)